jgi:hypothetical protein
VGQSGGWLTSNYSFIETPCVVPTTPHQRLELKVKNAGLRQLGTAFYTTTRSDKKAHFTVLGEYNKF